MIQIQVPLNRSEINKQIQIKYQSIWETQSIEPNVKNIQIINMQNKHMEVILYRLKTGHNRLTSSIRDPPRAGGGGHGNQLMYGPPPRGVTLCCRFRISNDKIFRFVASFN